MSIRTTSAGPAGARILGVGAYRPQRVVTNDEVCELIDSSDEWIRERSGIVSRHRAAAGETVVDLAEAAARVALERAGVAPGDVDAVIVATITHMFQTPSAATLLAHRLGTDGPMAIDLSAACAGFCHGVGLANDMIRAGSARTVLVVGAEVMSQIIDPTDRGSAFIFGDGAGAVVVGGADEPGIGPTVWGSDGGQWDLIRQTDPWVAAAPAGHPWVFMAGPAVFRWAVWEMAPIARKAAEAAGVGIDDLTAFVPHQANGRIIDAMAKQIQLPASVLVARDITTTGNTSGASVPLAIDALLAEHPEASGGTALLIGFGAGLSYAAQVVRLP
ncbi:beta-ketoacyl-ACP synthase III [Spongisporangium articulatum]|uniref:Beta-ketoacyl-[acyl-carrier-protein] synthase III n=1 Tax=Spongisporangium articulatum TaxID=3362603 RepID=A0ABW8ALN3_9ACTN